jgi:hypothetical protein
MSLRDFLLRERGIDALLERQERQMPVLPPAEVGWWETSISDRSVPETPQQIHIRTSPQMEEYIQRRMQEGVLDRQPITVSPGQGISPIDYSIRAAPTVDYDARALRHPDVLGPYLLHLARVIMEVNLVGYRLDNHVIQASKHIVMAKFRDLEMRGILPPCHRGYWDFHGLVQVDVTEPPVELIIDVDPLMIAMFPRLQRSGPARLRMGGFETREPDAPTLPGYGRRVDVP